MLLRDCFYTLEEIISCVINLEVDGDEFCLYGDGKEYLDLSSRYFVADFPHVQDDREVYPESVKKYGLCYLYSGQQFVDVVTLLAERKPGALYEDYVSALNYYQDNDDFIDL